MHHDETHNEDRELRALLESHPVPAAEPGFYDRALVRATRVCSKRQRNRWLAAGFGSAVAAGLALWLVTATLLTSDELPVPDSALPGVAMTLEEPRTINLVFSSATALDAAMLTVSLPPGVELQGFPGQREVTWETSLTSGRNVLPLTLVALSPAGGELLARLEHDNRSRTFRVALDIS